MMTYAYDFENFENRNFEQFQSSRSESEPAQSQKHMSLRGKIPRWLTFSGRPSRNFVTGSRFWANLQVSHVKISCICLHVTTSPSMTFWAISRYPPYKWESNIRVFHLVIGFHTKECVVTVMCAMLGTKLINLMWDPLYISILISSLTWISIENSSFWINSLTSTIPKTR